MNCKHENVDVIDSSVTEISVFGAELLLEQIKCNECGFTWVQPYLALGELYEHDNMVVFNDVDFIPTLEYIINALGIKRKNIPEELITSLSKYTSEERKQP